MLSLILNSIIYAIHNNKKVKIIFNLLQRFQITKHNTKKSYKTNY